jgi:predicted dehydrogenase
MKLANRKLRIAVIGLGKMGLLHTSILNAIPNVEVKALVDKSAIMTRLCRKIFSQKGIIVLNDYEKLSKMDLDAVYVTTPISSHAPIIEGLFKKEITRNIFVEKTLGSNYEQSKRLLDFAGKVNSITMVGYMKRFSVIFRKAKELLEQQTLGAPYSFKA